MDRVARRLGFTFQEATRSLVVIGALLLLPVGVARAQTQPPLATVSFEFPSYNVSENAGTASITVRMDGTPSGPVSVVCSTTTGGTATAGVDYVPGSQVLTWQQNEAGHQDIHDRRQK